MNRTIHGHEFGGAGEQIKVVAVDEVAHGGAHHHYVILAGDNHVGEVKFQSGPVTEYGVNGVTEGALLAIVADRLNCFNGGPFRCRENSLAVTKIEEALHWLSSRFWDRTRRGVEGTNRA